MMWYTKLKRVSYLHFKILLVLLVVMFVGAGVGVAQAGGSVSCSQADVSGDGRVNIADLVTVAVKFGYRVGGIGDGAERNIEAGAPEDVNGDGVVNIIDLVLVARQFGVCPGFIVGDFSGDNCVNIQDFVWVADGQLENPAGEPEFYDKFFQIAEHFGEGCNPSIPKLSYSAEADVNGDFVVNKSDFDLVAGRFGQSGSGLEGDVDRDGSIMASDLVSIARRLGERAPQLPDLQVVSVTGYSRDYMAGELVDQDVTVGPWSTVLFVAHVKNAGPVAMPAGYPVRWFVSRVEVGSDGNEIALQTLTYDKLRSDSPALGVGEASGDYDFQFPWIVDPARVQPGTYRFTAFVNQGSVVREISPDNNTGLFAGRIIVSATRPLVRGDINRDYNVDALDINGLQRRIRLAVLLDYDGNGSVGAEDARMLAADIAGSGSVPVEKIKDVDGNGQVNALDVAILERSEDELDFNGDGVLDDEDVRVLGEIITGRSQSSPQQDVSERVVFVPIQEKPAKARGFASVLKSILWVIGNR